MSRLTAQELELSARVLLRRHGPDAPVEARRQAESCVPGGQSHWVATWLLIAEICEELLAGPSAEAPLTHPAG
ncbi:hypothetical protein [Inquilinus limosus]|uniref:hypothetical protein n=1 Tax=Inquilinus limosus TaxID=171674 RepID=UPI0012699F2C|nr:hypothetical protein [Inquilinus limosus]